MTPGTVLILLAGRFKGKRVVFLKQLENGLLLIPGPFKVNQNYLTATSIKLHIGSVDVSKYTDTYFKREIVKKKKKGENEFFEAEKEREEKVVPEEEDYQKALDSLLIPIIEKTPDIRSYLSARFSLKSGVQPHELVF